MKLSREPEPSMFDQVGRILNPDDEWAGCFFCDEVLQPWAFFCNVRENRAVLYRAEEDWRERHHIFDGQFILGPIISQQVFDFAAQQWRILMDKELREPLTLTVTRPIWEAICEGKVVSVAAAQGLMKKWKKLKADHTKWFKGLPQEVKTRAVCDPDRFRPQRKGDLTKATDMILDFILEHGYPPDPEGIVAEYNQRYQNKRLSSTRRYPRLTPKQAAQRIREVKRKMGWPKTERPTLKELVQRIDEG